LPCDLPAYDCVLALDLIEHIADDCQAVQRLCRLVNPGGRLILSAAAIPELYSEFDEIQDIGAAILQSRCEAVSSKPD